MSDANVIHDISSTLRALLDARFNGPGSPGGGGASVTVTVDSPHRGTHDELRINLYLYNIVQDEGRRNIGGGWVPLMRTASSQTFAAEPLALRLYYLVTAFAVDGLTEHGLLGQAMQELYKNRRIPHDALKGTLKDSTIQAEDIQLILLNLDVDSLNKIWGNPTEPMRTSVAYEVELVFLETGEAGAEVELVEERFVEVVPVPYLLTVSPEAARSGATVRLHGANMVVPVPGSGENMVRFWFGDIEAKALPDRQSGGALSVVVPAGVKAGRTDVRLTLDRFTSPPVTFIVLEPAG